MKTDGVFSTYVYEIPFKKYGESIYIGATGDWHRNSRGHDKEKFESFIGDLAARKGYLIGTGDYLDSVSSSERKALKAIEIHDSTVKDLEAHYVSHVDDLAGVLKSLKGRIIGLGGGNHYYEFQSGITSDQLLCQKLGCRYFGVNAIIRLILRLNDTHAHKVDVCIHHGRGGGGRRVGTSLNHLQDMANMFSADIVLQGHDHNRAVDYINRLGLSSNDILENRKILLARTGSFLKSYQEGQSSYAVDAMYSPADLGGVLIKLTPMRSHKGNPREDKRWVDIEATI